MTTPDPKSVHSRGRVEPSCALVRSGSYGLGRYNRFLRSASIDDGASPVKTLTGGLRIVIGVNTARGHDHNRPEVR